MQKLSFVLLSCFFSFGLMTDYCHASDGVAVGDLVNVRGIRNNQLVGIGLVIGLAGTGDTKKSLATNKALSNMFTRLGIHSNSEDVVTGNVATVVVTADLPSFSRIGDRFDVRVSAVGDASRLSGGTLLLTPLKAGDGKVYATSQGVVVEGDESSVPSVVGNVTEGGQIEREFRPKLGSKDHLILSLKTQDVHNNALIVDAINNEFKGFFASSLDPTSIRVNVPKRHSQSIVKFLSLIKQLRISPHSPSIVVINQKTGTLVMGQEVRIDPVVVSHKGIAIKIEGREDSKGNTAKIGGSTVGDLIETINALGLQPKDLTSIIQSIHAAGALRADIKII